MQVFRGFGKLELRVEESVKTISYAVWEGKTCRTAYSISKLRPGWKRVWDETLTVMLDAMSEAGEKEGTGLQSRAFQPNLPTLEKYIGPWG